MQSHGQISGAVSPSVVPVAILGPLPPSEVIPPKPPKRVKERAVQPHRDPLAAPRMPSRMVSPLAVLRHLPATVETGLIEGDELRAKRKKLRLSQGELGEELVCTARAISNYETDARALPIELYARLYQALYPHHAIALAVIDADTREVLRVI